jgi:hypothetical protein
MRLTRRGRPEAPGPLAPPGSAPVPGAAGPNRRGGRRYDPAWNDWTPPRRWPGILLSSVIVLGFMGVVIWHLRPHTTVHRPKVVFSSKVKILPTFMPSPKGARANTFVGTHDMNGLRFLSNGGLLVIHAQCTCQYNFVVTISNAEYVPIAFPVNATGRVNSVLETSVPAGESIVRVVGEGHWLVQLVQPVATTPVLPTPFTYFSQGNDVLGPFSAADRDVSLQYLSTDGSLQVYVLNEQGFGVQTPFVGRIALMKSKVLAPLTGPYFLAVNSTSGLWNLEVGRTPAH